MDRYARNRDCKKTDIIEIKAFIGLLYMAGIKKINHLNLFAETREIFDLFIEKCWVNYQVEENVTIDEMLESFRGRCKFRMYIANKPAKYGIKVYALCDAHSYYTSNLEIYPGKQPNGPYKYDNSPSAVVTRLSKDILNSGRNITADNYFTSIPLADELLTKRTTLVGTIRKNKREIPPMFLNIKIRPKPSSIFGFHTGKVLVSYIPNKKNKKNVLMISTLHNDDRIDPETGDDAKPEIITFYNKTKGGVDVVDRLKEEYSVARVACRWPLRIFFSILNIAGIKSQIIYHGNCDNLITRREYLKKLSLTLTQEHINRRSSLQNISYLLKQIITRFSNKRDVPETETPPGICAVCPRRKNRKTKKACVYCKKNLCSEHAKILCDMCKSRLYDED